MVGRIGDLVPEEPPSRLHGDLWNGNVLWGNDGVVTMVDPAAYAGHREIDLAMLALFGLPHLQRALDAYAEARAARGGLGGPGRAAPAVPAAGARLHVRRRLRRPRGRRWPLATDCARSQGWLRVGWHSRHVTSASGPATKPRVLVVDDDRAVRESLRRSLEFNGYDVSLASDGAEALAGIAGVGPDVVVMDVMMPRLDGLEATRALRAAGNDVPILVLTARDAVGDRVEGLDAGADDYLTKPFALQELLARLRALLRRVRPARGRPRRAPDLRRPEPGPRHPRGPPRRPRASS